MIRTAASILIVTCALGAQAWLTGTDAGTFGALAGRAQFFGVCDAAVARQAGFPD